jgi:tetratricopeptide (TPR) repeat protein
MKIGTFQLGRIGVLAATVAVLGGWIAFSSVAPAIAQESEEMILQQEGVLQPAYREHQFTGKAGQAITITMTSDEFDTVLSLLGPDGQEIAYNDDDGRSLNSRIIATLPSDGVYVIQARSYGGMVSGTYTVTVQPATPYDIAYSEGLNLYNSGDYEGAIAAYDRAIGIDPNQPEVYLSRADALYGLAQQLRPEEKEAILSNYRQALELYEQSGNEEAAQMLRDQIQYMESPETYPGPF